jgi:nucleoid-associated protein YgaU
MGLVQQAVLDFDEEIRAPWRPRLVVVAGVGESAAHDMADREMARHPRPHPSGRSSSRVGVCRPVEPLPRVPARTGARASVTAGPPVEGRRRPTASPQGRRPSRRGLRLTRRARLLATVLTLALGVAIGSWLGPLLAGGDGDLRLAGAQSVVVQPGDTLWSIADGVAGTADVRGVVDRIQELNGLHTTVLIPGQVLELP